MKPFKRLLLLAAGVALVGSLFACKPRPQDPAEVAERITDRISEDLDLDEVQRTKLDTAKDTLLAVRERERTDPEERQAEILSVLEGERMDRERALELVKRRTNAVEEAAPEVIAAVADFYDSLTPEQQAELRERIKERMGRSRRYWD